MLTSQMVNSMGIFTHYAPKIEQDQPNQVSFNKIIYIIIILYIDLLVSPLYKKLRRNEQ